MSKTGDYLLVGLKNGWIALWSAKRHACKIVIKTLFTTSVLDIKFMSNENKIYKFLASDSVGNVHSASVEFGFFYDSVRYESLVKMDYPVYNICVLSRNEENKKLMDQQKSECLACFVGLNVLIVCTIKPTLKKLFKFEKPKYYKDGQYLPNISFGIGYIPYFSNSGGSEHHSFDTSFMETSYNYSRPQLLLAISWGKLKLPFMGLLYDI